MTRPRTTVAIRPEVLEAEPEGGSRAGADALVVDHLWLADALAGRYAGRGLERDDLSQVARLALVKAAKRFDVAVGASFPAYATACITGEIKRHFRDVGWMVRPPRRLQELSAQQRQCEGELNLRLGRPPTAVELAAALGVSVPELRRVEATSGCFHGASLDVPGNQGAGVLRWVDPGDDPHVAIEERDWLTTALAELSERELGVIRLRFVHGMTQSQIGGQIGLSQIQVSRILRSALERLRRTMTASLVAA